MKAWLWRKYALGHPAIVFAGQPWAELEGGLVVWPTPDSGQWPALNRWQSLGPAFFGFVSRGLEPPHACVYLAAEVLKVADNELLARTWVEAADAAELYEWMTGNLLGVWMGEKTPYLLTETPELLHLFSRQSDFL